MTEYAPDPYTAPLIARYTCGHLRDLRAGLTLPDQVVPADAMLSEQNWPCPDCQDPKRPLLHREALAGRHSKRPHSCRKCKRDMYGPRVYCEKCWENMPAHVKARMINKAMEGSDLSISIEEIDGAFYLATRRDPDDPPLKRLKPIPYDKQPPVSGGLP